MLKKIIITVAVILVLIVVVFVGVVAVQPADYRITRTATIPAAAPEVFAQVNDFHKWDAWSPWAKLDPAVKYTFEGPPAGTGAILKWVGNDKVGEGAMLITESHPSDLVRIKLDFIKPFSGTCATEFTFKEEGNQTVTTWTMSGTRTFTEKAVCLFMDMEKMIGADFEKGLANMKSVVAAK